jgi:hypothetical protein
MIRLSPIALCCLAFFAPAAAHAQFKEVGPAPYSQAVARQKIRTLLEKTEPDNPKPTVDALFALVPWYRDLLDQELAAAWQKDYRAGLARVIEPLADTAVASAIVEYSWHKAPEAVFNVADAPLLGQLMARYPASATPFLNDLRGQTPALPDSVAEAVCRILIDMPDLGTWRKDALQILPHYRQTAERLLNQDVRGDDREKSYKAQMWLRELNGDQPGMSNPPQMTRRKPAVAPGHQSAPVTTADGRPTLVRPDAPPPASAPPQPAPAPAPPTPSLYSGARSGTLQCSGSPIPQNAEYVFRNLPPGNITVDVDTRIWGARLTPDQGQTQKLVLKNISSGPQKKCKVQWSMSP